MLCAKNKIMENKTLISSGFILIILATFNFSYQIPKLDNKIRKIDDRLQNLEFNIFQMHIAQSTGSLTFNQMKLLKEINPSSKTIKELYWDSKLCKEIYLRGAKLLAEGKIKSEEIKDNETTLKELDKEIKKYLLNTTYQSKLVEQKKGLLDKKEVILFWSILFQIIGLCLTQIAIILPKKPVMNKE